MHNALIAVWLNAYSVWYQSSHGRTSCTTLYYTLQCSKANGSILEEMQHSVQTVQA
jgi:hypothetical protein